MEKLKGGKADKLSIEDIAKKHKIDVDLLKVQLKNGIEIEKEEHTNDPEKAEEIAKDHLYEFPDYYTRLKKMEKTAEKSIETKESMGADASGSFEAPAFGQSITKREIQEMMRKSKQVNEVADAGISAGSMYDGPIGTAGASSPMDRTKKKRKDPLKLDKKTKSASITAASTDDMISTKKGFPRFGGPKAKFVEVDERCKRFPYCNQGNQGQLKFISEMNSAIKEISTKYGLTVEQVTDMVMKEALPRGIFDDPSNQKAFASWTKKNDEKFHITTETPVDIVTSDEVDIAKLKVLLNRYDIKFTIEKLSKESEITKEPEIVKEPDI